VLQAYLFERVMIVFFMCFHTLCITWCSERGARGSVFGWGTMLQAGRTRVQFPMRSLDFFFNWPNPSSRTMVLGSTQPLTEMSTRDLPGGKGKPAHKADNLTAICEPIAYRKCGSLDISQLTRLFICGSFNNAISNSSRPLIWRLINNELVWMWQEMIVV
jgi:hypothetical protein